MQKLWSCSLHTQPTHSRPDPTLGSAEPWPCPLVGQCKFWDTLDPIPNCFRNQPSPTNDPKQPLVSLGPPPRLQESALPASSQARTPGPGFTLQWAGNSPGVLRTLTPLKTSLTWETIRQVQEMQRFPYRMNPKRNKPRHTVIKMTKIIKREY